MTERFAADCPCRSIYPELADKWVVMVLSVLEAGPCRFNGLRRRLEGISQRSLTLTLRRMERDGFVSRIVHPGPPLAVEYALRPLGRSLLGPCRGLYDWVEDNAEAVVAARAEFDAAAPG